MSSFKKIDLERDFAAGVYLSEAQTPPPPYILYTRIQYTYSHRDGGRGLTREKGRAPWVTNITDCVSSL
jgi:hypothetical protein